MEGKARYSFSIAGESEQAVGFDCAQTELHRTDRRAMARMEGTSFDDCSAPDRLAALVYEVA
jgi:hypothetical protein